MDRTKWIFWGAVLSALLLICIPSSLLLRAISRYRRLAQNIEMAPLIPTRAHFIPHRKSRALDKPRLEFVKFSVKAPRAKKVELIGDFNRWEQGTLTLTRQINGLWQITLPLPSGHYRYVFAVDGLRERDPLNDSIEDLRGTPVSVKVVP